MTDLRYIKEYIENRGIKRIKKLNRGLPQHQLCNDIATCVADVYIQNRSLAKTSEKIGIAISLLRDFLIDADRLEIIDYKCLEIQSKHPNFTWEQCQKLKKGRYKHPRITDAALEYKQWGEKRKRAFKRQVKQCLKQYGSVNKVAKLMNIPHTSLQHFLLSEYKCSNIPELKGKLKIMRPLSKEKEKKLQKAWKIYETYGTLEDAAKELHITRERVRQLLAEGKRYGLFEYEINREKKLQELINKYDKDSLIRKMKELVTNEKLCQELNITQAELYQLIKHYGIDATEYRKTAQMGKWLAEYSKIVDFLGYHPSTTEMQSREDWRNVYARITWHWGNIDNFRKEFGIEKPKMKIHPNTTAAWKERIEKQKRAKRERKEKILELLTKENRAVGTRFISDTLRINPAVAYNCLIEMAKDGKIEIIGTGSAMKYIAKLEVL